MASHKTYVTSDVFLPLTQESSLISQRPLIPLFLRSVFLSSFWPFAAPLSSYSCMLLESWVGKGGAADYLT